MAFSRFLSYGVCNSAKEGNASFKNSVIICQSPLPSSPPDMLLMDRRDGDGFISKQRVCIISDSTYNTMTHH